MKYARVIDWTIPKRAADRAETAGPKKTSE